ncbi:MAG: hypothetical protein JXB34_04255 [Bacteroidales bacterium]|nr:hypothetical protein [Bacteroidales bacterium]
MQKFLFLLIFTIAGLAADNKVYSQQEQEVKKHLYRPNLSNNIENPITETQHQPDSGFHAADSIIGPLRNDSLLARLAYIKDSLLMRQKMLDSLIFLAEKLPPLLEVGIWLQSSQVIIDPVKIELTSDSTLGSYKYVTLPISFTQPYTPWIETISLDSGSFKVTRGPDNSIISIRDHKINLNFGYTPDKNIIVISETGIFASKNGKMFYKQLFDSVFYNNKGRVAVIKRYVSLHQATETYQKGKFLFTHLYEVKQFNYNLNNMLEYFELVNFCEKWTMNDPSKVCSIIKYTISKNNNTYTVSKQHNPANEYADGEYVYEFDLAHNLKSVSFSNFKNTERWKTSIEVNQLGHVTRYIYEVNNKINNTLLFNYYLNDPLAKHKVESISCSFEDDGVSYFQKNLTTGKSRVRDKFTGEWSAWK